MKRKLVLLCLTVFVAVSFMSFLPLPTTVKAPSPTITYSYPTITISDYTVGTPCTSRDVYLASVAGGWGVVGISGMSQNSFSFLVDLKLASGYFRDTNVNLFFNTTWAGTNDRIWIQSGANFSLGTLVDPITKRTTDGCNIIAGASAGGGIIDVDSGGVLELYGCHLTTLEADTLDIQGNATIYESSLTNIGFILSQTGVTIDAYRINIEGSTVGIANPSATTIFDDLLVHSMTKALTVAGTISPTVTNLIGRNNTKLVECAFYSGNLYLVDADVDPWAFNYIVSPNGKIHRQYSFDLLVTYLNGTAINGTEMGARVVVQHYGQGGAVDYNATLGEDGTIPPQTLTMGLYTQANGDTRRPP